MECYNWRPMWGSSTCRNPERKGSEVEDGARWLRRYTSGYVSVSEVMEMEDEVKHHVSGLMTLKSVMKHQSPSVGPWRRIEFRSSERAPDKRRSAYPDQTDGVYRNVPARSTE